jgi:hypothetical protein
MARKKLLARIVRVLLPAVEPVLVALVLCYFDSALQKFDRDGQKFFDRVSKSPESSEISTMEFSGGTDFNSLGSDFTA